MNIPATRDTPALRQVVLGTAGHIDHGKTTLVYALTGTDTDRLPEEKQRGITIDLGFASLQLKDEHGDELHLSLIDVPGHHAFIRNMLAGTGGIDCALLVVAADEGVKAQTIEHLAICELLGIERGVVALTKCDAVTPEHLRATTEQVRRLVHDTFLANAPIVPVSAVHRDGIEELKRALAHMASSVPAPDNDHVMRLPLDRSFTLRGFGTVVTGTLHSGTVRVGDTLQQQPGGRVLRVRSLQVHGQSRDSARAPSRLALNLPGVEAEQIGRGHTLTMPDAISLTSTVDVVLKTLPGPPALRHGALMRVHAFTSETLAKVLLFDHKKTGEGGSSFARLKLARPLLLIPGDRMVLRQSSPALTIGGARVLDAAPALGQRKYATLQWLSELSSAGDTDRLRLRVARRGADGMTLLQLRSETGITLERLREQLVPFIQSGELIQSRHTADHYFASTGLAEALKRANAELTTAHSLPCAELRSRAGLNAAVSELVIDRLVASGTFDLDGTTLRKKGHAISDKQLRQMQSIENAYEKAGLASPLLADVIRQAGISASAARELITVLLRSKRLVRMGGDETLVHSDALERLYSTMRERRGESFDVGQFKTLTGLTRKHAIPLLEHLDQARVTRNVGGVRIVL